MNASSLLRHGAIDAQRLKSPALRGFIAQRPVD
jgi:hypothetical protein